VTRRQTPALVSTAPVGGFAACAGLALAACLGCSHPHHELGVLPRDAASGGSSFGTAPPSTDARTGGGGAANGEGAAEQVDAADSGGAADSAGTGAPPLSPSCTGTSTELTAALVAEPAGCVRGGGEAGAAACTNYLTCTGSAKVTLDFSFGGPARLDALVVRPSATAERVTLSASSNGHDYAELDTLALRRTGDECSSPGSEVKLASPRVVLRARLELSADPEADVSLGGLTFLGAACEDGTRVRLAE
jgi:hypothetical protein